MCRMSDFLTAMINFSISTFIDLLSLVINDAKCSKMDLVGGS